MNLNATDLGRLQPEIEAAAYIAQISQLVGQQTMIAEAPSSLCTAGATAYRRKQMRDTRSVARVCARARVTGVAFFDFLHGQTGVAPNGIELHPILGFACLTS